jgi:2-polyprenyl-3-methyl-5-hydroxy-6-metoxy-1,4-benzoquinol methylase
MDAAKAWINESLPSIRSWLYVLAAFYVSLVVGYYLFSSSSSSSSAASAADYEEHFDNHNKREEGGGRVGLLSRALMNFSKTLIKQDPTGIYDSFYSKVYDLVFHNGLKDEFEVYNIVQFVTKEATPARDRLSTLSKASVLDLGCGVGHHLAAFAQQGSSVTGVDISMPMLQSARNKIPSARLVHGDFMHGAILPASSYDIVLCMFFTVYYVKDVDVFFNNCNRWLKPNGYLCLHLVHTKKFDPVLEKSSKLIPAYAPQKYVSSPSERITHTELTFNKFLYSADWTFGASEHDKSVVHFKEDFKYKDGSLRRIHEHTLYMHGIKYYVTKANAHGFKLQKVIDLIPAGHDHSYIYIFKKQFAEHSPSSSSFLP